MTSRSRPAIHRCARRRPAIRLRCRSTSSRPPSERPAVDAAVAAVLSQRVWAAPPDRRARSWFCSTVGAERCPQHVEVCRLSGAAIQQPWMADAVARIARDRRSARGRRARRRRVWPTRDSSAAPWQTLASAADGRPLAVAAGSANGLVVVTAAPASDVATPVLLRSIANALAPPLDLQRAEVVPIADAVLQRWSRPPAPVTVAAARQRRSRTIGAGCGWRRCA